MSRKDYKLEIVESLLKSDNYIRGLAKKLKTNQMMILRKIKDLEKENVVDFKREGKNKVYFLKKTLEAYEYAIISEYYKLLKTIKQL